MVRARETEKVTKRHRPVSSVSRRTRIRIPTHIPRAIIAIQKSTGGRSSPATPATSPTCAARPKSASTSGVPLIAVLK